ncbi:MAG: hypothetical protein NTW87_14090 [Planctomycetota bacterium]|nr:hypothetical protein [Planctomycetota bacterium]
MAYMVEMHYNRPFEPGFRSFDCHGDVWYKALDLMKRHGWKPRGTQQPPMGTPQGMVDGRWFAWDPKTEHNGNYEPEDYAFGSTVVGPEDAQEMAQALEKALGVSPAKNVTVEKQKQPLLLSDTMTDEEFIAANRPFGTAVLTDMHDFIRQGPFRVNWDD